MGVADRSLAVQRGFHGLASCMQLPILLPKLLLAFTRRLIYRNELLSQRRRSLCELVGPGRAGVREVTLARSQRHGRRAA